MKEIQYNGYTITTGFYANGDVTVQIDGDDVMFHTVEEAKEVIDEIQVRKMMESLMEYGEKAMEFVDELSDTDVTVFGSIICTMIDAWCGKKGLNSVEFAKEILPMIAIVNKECGPMVID